MAKAHVLDGDDPRKLNVREKPYLLFPVGKWADDPAKFLAFLGISPHAVAKSGFDRLRALATIEFFALDDIAARKNLFRERATILVSMYPQLEVLATSASSAARKKRAEKVVDAATSFKAPHANCARSFKRLFERAPGQALEMFDAAAEYVQSIS